MTDFFIYRSCDLTDLGVREILNRQKDIIDRGIAIIDDPSGVPDDPADGSDNPTLDIVTAEWTEPVDGNGNLPAGTFEYDIIPVDTCTGRTGNPIALPSLTLTEVRARGSVEPPVEALVADGDTFTLDDGTNPAVTFEFDKNEAAAVGSIVTGGDTIRFGSAASLGAAASGVITVTGLAGMTATSVGNFLNVSNADTVANNAQFLIIAFNSATSVDVAARGAPGSDANNGSLTWNEQRNIDESAITDGDTFVLDDGVNPAVTFEFDKNGSVVDTPTLRAVDLTGTSKFPSQAGSAGVMGAPSGGLITVTGLTGMTDASIGNTLEITGAVAPANNGRFLIIAFNSATSVDIVAQGAPGSEASLDWEEVFTITFEIVSVRIANAITAAPTLDISVTSAGSGEVSLLNDTVGAQGNVPITQGGTAPLIVTGMAGGAAVVETPTLRKVVLSGGETPNAIGVAMVAAINSAPTLDITASGGLPVVDLVNDTPGTAGNVAITQSGSGSLVITGMAGGAGVGQTAQLLIQFGDLPTECDAAQLRRDGVVFGDAFPLDDIPANRTVVITNNLIGNYDTTDASPGQVFQSGRAGFRRLSGADLIGGDVIKYNDFTVKITQVIGAVAPQDVFFSPRIPETLIEPEGFYDAANRSGFYEGFTTSFNVYGELLPGFGAVSGVYAPKFLGIQWIGPLMAFKTVPNHVYLPNPFLPFFNDLQPGDILARGAGTELVVYVERNPLALPNGFSPAAGTVLTIPFGISGIFSPPAGQFWVVYRSVNPPVVGFYYSMYDNTSHEPTPPFDPTSDPPPGPGDPEPGIEEGTDPTGLILGSGLFGNFDSLGPQLLRGGISLAEATAGSGLATGTIITDNSGAEAVQVIDGETFTIDDGTNPAVTFEFDDNGSVVETPTLRRVDISAATTSVDVAEAIIASVNVAPAFTITASDGGINIVQLQNTVNLVGAVPIVTTVASPFVSFSGMDTATPDYSEFLDVDALNPGQPQNRRNRLNAFRVIGNGEAPIPGVGPPTALVAGQMLIIDGQLVTVSEVTEILPPGGFPNNPLPGFPGTYEVEFSPKLDPEPLELLPGIRLSRPSVPIGPWVTIPSFDSPYLISPLIQPTGQYERLTRQNNIEQRVTTWEFSEDGVNQEQAGTVDGTEAAEELNEVFVQNNYPGGLNALLDEVRGATTPDASSVFVITNGTMTFVSPRVIPANPLVEIANGVTIDLQVIRGLVNDACGDVGKLFEIKDALNAEGFAIMRQEFREVQIPAALCPPGQPDAREVRLFCLETATASNGLRDGEAALVYFRTGVRSQPGIRAKLIRYGLTEAEADAALQLQTIERVVASTEILEQTLVNVQELNDLGSDDAIADVLDDVRIEVINTGTITREMVGELIRNRGEAGIISRFPGTDPAVARDPASRPIDDFILPMHRFMGLAFQFQASFDLCDYDAALASIPDPDLRAQIGGYFATVESLLANLRTAGEAMIRFLEEAPGFAEATNAIGGIVSGSDSDPTLACLAGPQGGPSTGGVGGNASLNAVNTLLSNLSSGMQTKFNLSQLFGQAMVSVLCSTIGGLNSALGVFGVNTDDDFTQRAIGCLPSIEDLQTAGVEFPSLEAQIAFECSIDQLNIYLDIINALIAEANEVVDFANAMDSGFISRAIEARNRMCSSDQGLESLLGGLRAFVGVG